MFVLVIYYVFILPFKPRNDIDSGSVAGLAARELKEKGPRTAIWILIIFLKIKNKTKPIISKVVIILIMRRLSKINT